MSVLFNLLLFIIPFVFIPLNNFQFEIPKVILSEIAIIAITISFFLKKEGKPLPQTGVIKIDKGLLAITSAIFTLTIIDLIFFTGRTSDSFFGNTFRLQGIFLLWLLLILSVTSSIIKIKKIKTKWLLLILIGELMLSFIIGGTIDGRIVGTLGEPNMLASFVIFILPLILFSSDKENKLKITGVALALIIIFLTGSRSGLLAFVIEIIAFFLVRFKRIPLNKITAITILLVILSMALPLIDKTPSLLENRKEIWKVSVNAGLKSPLVGSGVGNIEKTIKTKAVKEGSPIQYAYIDRSHNLILDWWIEGGIIGAVIILSLISFTIYNLVKKKKVMYLFAFIGLLTTMLFNPASIVGLSEFFFIAGLSFQNKL